VLAGEQGQCSCGRVYLGQEGKKQKWYWVGRFERKRDRDEAVAKAKAEKPWLKDADPTEFTCDQWCERYLAKVEREQKASSLYTARQALKAFRAEFGNRSLGSIGDVEAEDWVNSVPPSSVPGSLRA
jgi:hypothetical protein